MFEEQADATPPTPTRRRMASETVPVHFAQSQSTGTSYDVAVDIRESKQVREILKPEAFSGKYEDFSDFLNLRGILLTVCNLPKF